MDASLWTKSLKKGLAQAKTRAELTDKRTGMRLNCSLGQRKWSAGFHWQGRQAYLVKFGTKNICEKLYYKLYVEVNNSH